MNLPKRKHTRLKDYDYRQNGAYFVTICTDKRRQLLSEVITVDLLHPPVVALTPVGEIAEAQLLALPQRYPHLQICKYVIMPNHIHILLQFVEETAGASPRPTKSFVCGDGQSPGPTLTDIICAYKSLTARAAKDVVTDKLFQTSFYDHVLRSEEEFTEVWQYIEDNPAKWEEDIYYHR